MFFRKVKFWTGDAPPIFNLDGVSYIFIKKNGLYFVATTCHNVSPSAVVELLSKMAKVFKDFCGVLNEESIRKNFVLVYELLDEMVDFGGFVDAFDGPRAEVWFEPAAMEPSDCIDRSAPIGLGAGIQPTVPAVRCAIKRETLHDKLANSDRARERTLSLTPIPNDPIPNAVGPTQNDSSKSKKNEIFVDILERLYSGKIVIAFGMADVVSYLMGNPELKLALNEDINIKNMELGGLHGGYGSVVLDDCNFHECVDLQDFSELRTLSFYPPDGEFAVMNYRITGDFRVPFRIFPFAEQQTPHKIEITIKVRADIPEQNYGGNVQISCMLPKAFGSSLVRLVYVQ
ncbi:unnamed protein product [Polarella glacialis]|uniref:MHD domain-containing protein n=1 Tax=Polarella glacialis TaxID=89957 RepID=A0A813DN82_POLGL|nr:unnamed protein product [Polarella glacialis]